jgi:DNA polymerase III subunit delta
MATLKPAYLVHGEDHGGIAERRARLRTLAEQQGGAAAVEILAGDQATPEAVAHALNALTFALGQRVIIVEGVERWRQADVEKHLKPAMEAMPPDTTLALFAREETKAKAPAALHEAVKAAGGRVVQHATVKPWELPRWVMAEASRLGLTLDVAAAKALIAQVGERQQRLLRELEKIALELEDDAAEEGRGAIAVNVEEIEARAARSAERRAFTLADALVGGDVKASLRAYLSLESQGERLPSLSWQIAARLRDAIAVSERLANGEPPKGIARSLRMPAKAAERFVADVSRADRQRLADGLASLADVELDLRGGSRVTSARRPAAALSERTVAVLTVRAIAGKQA